MNGDYLTREQAQEWLKNHSCVPLKGNNNRILPDEVEEKKDIRKTH